VFAQLALARLVDRHGLGSGVATLIAAGVASSLWTTVVRAFQDTLLDAQIAVIVVATFVGIVLSSARWVGRKVTSRGVSLRAPLSGIDPVVSASALMVLPVTLANLGLRMPSIPLTVGTTLHTVVFYLATIAFTVVLSFLFHRPSRVAEATGASRAAVVSARRKALRTTLVFVLAIATGDLVIRMRTGWDNAVTGIALLGVVILDAYEEADARRLAARWVPYATVHRTYDLDPLLERLAKEKIDPLLSAVRTRTFFQFFAPWAPIEILVPEDAATSGAPLLDDRAT
jgi:preprotein translocase subunit SecY